MSKPFKPNEAGNNKVDAELRTKFGKGAARKLRAVNKIPAVIYGHGTDPVHVALPSHRIGMLLRKSNAVLELDIEGTTQLALVKDVQKDPVLAIIEHLDLIVVTKGEKVHVDVPVHLVGETAAGTIANFDMKALSLEVEATHIPETVIADIEGLEDGDRIYAADITLPKGATLLSEPDMLVIYVQTPRGEDEETEDEEEAAEGTEGEAAAESAE